MLPHDVTRLRHMIDSAKEALEFTNGKSRSDLDDERILSLAIIKSIEIIGEAASKVSKTISEAFSNRFVYDVNSLPWPDPREEAATPGRKPPLGTRLVPGTR